TVFRTTLRCVRGTKTEIRTHAPSHDTSKELTVSQPLTKSPDELIAQLAELDEQQESGTKLVPTGSTVENVKAEWDTFLSDLRQPLPRDEYADESACEQVIQLVQTIGREPSDPGDKTVATPTGQT